MVRKRTVALLLILVFISIGFLYFRNLSTKPTGLDGFYRWTKEDPLFYSPDLDINGMKTAVDNIDKDQNKLLEFLSKKEHIYPTDFLKEFVKTASQTSTFLKNPSKEEAQELIRYQKQAVSSYKREVESLLKIIPTAYPDRDFSSVSINVSLSIGTIMDDLKKIENNSNSLLEEIDKREKCLEGKGECEIPSDNFKKPTNTSISRPSNVPNFLDKRFVFSPTTIHFKDELIMGPYRTKTPCFGLKSDYSYIENYFYIFPNSKSGTVIRLANDVFFQTLRSDSTLSWERDFANAGIKYIYSEASSPYRCNDANYFFEISQINLFLTSNKPIFDQIDVSSGLDIEFLKNAQNFEREFFNSQYPSYEDAQTLGDYYGYAYKLISQKSSLSKKYTSIKDDFLRRKLNLSEKLGGLTGMLNFSDTFIKTDIPVQKERSVANLTSIYIYAFKNYYGVMYFPFSSSVYRNTQELSYVDKIFVENAVVLDGARMSYTQALAKYSKDEILKWFVQKPFLINN